MQISFKKLTLQNFYSYGKQQTIDFDNFDNNIILIDGIDKDTEGSKIGSGKSSIFAGLTYALFGKTVSSIKANDVVNYVKGKNCLVTLTLTLSGNLLKIERGRLPKILNVYSYDKHGVEENLTRADDKDNDFLIEKLIGINYETFLQTVLFSVSDHKQFLSLRPIEQKRIFESIFKFDEVNDVIQNTKDENREYENKINELKSANEQIEISNMQITNQISRLQEKAENFEIAKKKKIKKLQDELDFFKNVDISEEQKKHSFMDEMTELKNELRTELNELKLEKKDIENDIEKLEIELKKINNDLENENNIYKSLKQNMCPTCGQEWLDEHAIIESQEKVNFFKNEIIVKSNIYETHKKHLESIEIDISFKRTGINDIREVMENIIPDLDKKELNNYELIKEGLIDELNKVEQEDNYYLDEIENNTKLLRKIDYSVIDKYQNLYDISKCFIDIAKDTHTRGAFLRKFIKQMNEIFRKFKSMIPDYNIHIQFNKDFSVRLMKLGKEIPVGSLSNGEKRIGEIMIMLALMKIFKLKNNVLFDTMFMDEVLDSGINGTLLEVVYKFIEEFGKQENIRIFLISHREEIKNKMDEMIFVTKSSSISTLKHVKG